MSLIIIRTDTKTKLLNALADIERHANLKIMQGPLILESKLADNIVETILNNKISKKSKIATVIRVKQDSTFSILNIKKIHPPAHIIVISEEYKEYGSLKKLMPSLKKFKGYYSHINSS